MNPRTRPALWLAASVCGLAALACASPAAAQARLRAQADAPVDPPAPPYQDRFIDGGTLKPDVTIGEGGVGDPSTGLARSIELDGVVSSLHSNEGGATSSVVEKGAIVKAQWETTVYGNWSLDGSAHTGGDEPGDNRSGQGGLLALRERGMPFGTGWHADAALGDINSPDITLARAQARFYLPTAPMQGATTEWRGPSGLEVVAGGGTPGLYDGIAVPGFRTLGGSTATLGAEYSPNKNWTVGGQLVDAENVNLGAGPLFALGGRASSATGLLSAAWQDSGAKLQFSLLDGGISGSGNALGTWIDGTLSSGRVQQSAGLFRIDPNLTWGNQLIANDAEGGYYRYSYQSRQWLADVGIDEVHSVSGEGRETTFLTADTRYQVSRDWGVGGVANLSHSGGETAWSLQGSVDHLNSWGSNRVQLDFASTPSGTDTMLGLDQTWNMPAGLRLSTSVSLERIGDAILNDVPQNSTVFGVAVNGGGQLTGPLSIEANVRWTGALAGRAAPGVAATVSLTWQLNRDWQLLATYYDSETGSWTPLVVDSPLTPPSEVALPAIQERGAFLTIRYQKARGMHFAPLGGAPGSGSGELAGVVYLDANANQHFDAGEAGAANVTVVLDGRYSVQTDQNGRFKFPMVAAGHHVLTAIGDNVPLPWFLANDGKVEVDVATRGHTDVSVAAERIR
jgi:hypothetical protein